MRIFIHIEFSEKLDHVFFDKIDSCLERSGYLHGEFCQGYFDVDKKWRDISWGERTAKVSELFILKCEYLYSDKSSWNTLWVELPCKRIPLNLLEIGTSFDCGYHHSFTKVEKVDALRLEALALDLHKTLNASDTAAWSDILLAEGGEPWFRFSKEEWKTLGNLPIKEEND